MYTPLNTVSPPLNAGYPSLNDLLVRARWSQLSPDAKQQGRTRGSLRINLDVRRARQKNPSG